jgi:hypothetical protein
MSVAVFALGIVGVSFLWGFAVGAIGNGLGRRGTALAAAKRRSRPF